MFWRGWMRLARNSAEVFLCRLLFWFWPELSGGGAGWAWGFVEPAGVFHSLGVGAADGDPLAACEGQCDAAGVAV